MKFIVVLSILCSVFISKNLWADGGNGGPGGDTLVDRPMTPSDVMPTFFVKNWKVSLKGILRNLQYVNADNPDQPISSPLKVIFSSKNKKTIYQVLDGVSFQALDKEACIDSADGKERDAAARVDLNIICLSLSRIAAKTTTANIDLKLSALIIHELSHFMGANEDQAVGLQHTVEWSLSNNFRSIFFSGITEAKYQLSSKGVSDQIDKLLQIIDTSAPDTSLCASLGFTSSQLGFFENILSETGGAGVGIFDPHRSALAGMGLVAELLLTNGTFCQVAGLDKELLKYQISKGVSATLGDRIPLSMVLNPKHFARILDPITIRLVVPGNREQLKENVLQIREQLRDLKDHLPVLEK